MKQHDDFLYALRDEMPREFGQHLYDELTQKEQEMSIYVLPNPQKRITFKPNRMISSAAMFGIVAGFIMLILMPNFNRNYTPATLPILQDEPTEPLLLQSFGEGSVTALAYSADGESVYVASSTGLYRHDADDLTQRELVGGFDEPVGDVAVSGNLIAILSRDLKISILNTETGEWQYTIQPESVNTNTRHPIRYFDENEIALGYCAIVPNLLSPGICHYATELYNIHTGELIESWESTFANTAISSEFIVYDDGFGELHIINRETGEEQSIPVNRSANYAAFAQIEITQDSSKIVTLEMDDNSADIFVYAYDPYTLEETELTTIVRSEFGNYGIQLLPDNIHVMIIYGEQTIIYNMETGEQSELAHNLNNIDIDFSPNVQQFTKATYDGTLVTWNWADDEAISTADIYSPYFVQDIFMEQGVIVADTYTSIEVIDIQTGETTLYQKEGQHSYETNIEVHYPYIVYSRTANTENSTWLLNIETGEQTRIAAQFSTQSITFPDDNTVRLINSIGTLIDYDIPTGESTRSGVSVTAYQNGINFLPDANLIFTQDCLESNNGGSCLSKTYRLFDIERNALLFDEDIENPKGINLEITAISANWIVTTICDEAYICDLRLWDINAIQTDYVDEPLTDIDAYSVLLDYQTPSAMLNIQFMPNDPSQLAINYWDTVDFIQVNPETGETTVSYTLEDTFSSDIAFNEDGSLFVTTGYGIINVWQMPTVQPVVYTPPQPTLLQSFGEGSVTALAYSPDGESVYVASSTGLYRHDADDLAQRELVGEFDEPVYDMMSNGEIIAFISNSNVSIFNMLTGISQVDILKNYPPRSISIKYLGADEIALGSCSESRLGICSYVVEVYNISTGELVTSYPDYGYDMDISSNYIAYFDDLAQMHIVDRATSEDQTVTQPTSVSTSSIIRPYPVVDISPDESTFVTLEYVPAALNGITLQLGPDILSGNIISSLDNLGRVIGTIYPGEQLEVTARSGMWYQVRFNQTTVGYISSDLVEIAGDESLIPEIETGNIYKPVVKVYDATTFESRVLLETETDIYNLEVLPDNLHMILFSGSQITILNMETGETFDLDITGIGNVINLYSSTNEEIAVSLSNGTLLTWNWITDEVSQLQSYDPYYEEVVMLANDQIVLHTSDSIEVLGTDISFTLNYPDMVRYIEGQYPYVVYGTLDTYVKTWLLDITTGEERLINISDAQSVAFLDENTIRLINSSGTITDYDIASDTSTQRQIAMDVELVYLSPNGQFAFTKNCDLMSDRVCETPLYSVFDLEAGVRLFDGTHEALYGPIQDVTFSQDSEWMMTQDCMGCVYRLWNLKAIRNDYDGETLTSLNTYTSIIFSQNTDIPSQVEFIPGTELQIAANYFNDIAFIQLNPETGETTLRYSLEDTFSHDTAFNEDGSLFVTTGYGIINVWQMPTVQPTVYTPPPTSTPQPTLLETFGEGSVTALAYSADGESVYVASSTGLYRHDADNLTQRELVGEFDEAVYDVAVSGNLIAIFTSDFNIAILNTETGEWQYPIQPETVYIGTRHTIQHFDENEITLGYCADISDSSSMGVCNYVVELYNIHTGELIESWESTFANTAISSKFIVYDDGHGELHIIDRETGEEQSITKQNVPVNRSGSYAAFAQIKITQDSSKIITLEIDDSSQNLLVYAYDPYTLEATELMTINRLSSNFDRYQIQLLPDDIHVMIGYSGQAAIIYNMETGEQSDIDVDLYSFYIAFSPDGQRLAIAGYDVPLQIFQWTTNEVISVEETYVPHLTGDIFMQHDYLIADSRMSIEVIDTQTGETTSYQKTEPGLSDIAVRYPYVVYNTRLTTKINTWLLNLETGDQSLIVESYSTQSIAFLDENTVRLINYMGTLVDYDISTGESTRSGISQMSQSQPYFFPDANLVFEQDCPIANGAINCLNKIYRLFDIERNAILFEDVVENPETSYYSGAVAISANWILTNICDEADVCDLRLWDINAIQADYVDEPLTDIDAYSVLLDYQTPTLPASIQFMPNDPSQLAINYWDTVDFIQVNPQTGETTVRYTLEDIFSAGIAFNEDGSLFAAVENGIINVWQMP